MNNTQTTVIVLRANIVSPCKFGVVQRSVPDPTTFCICAQILPIGVGRGSPMHDGGFRKGHRALRSA